MPTFTKTIERTTDDPAEMTTLRYSGWEEKPSPDSPEKSAAPTAEPDKKPATRPAAPRA